MKQIEVNINELSAAFIDDKDVMSDWIVENLFDDGNYVREKNEAVGFIGGFPTFASWGGNELSIRMVGRGFMFPKDWTKEEVEACHSTIIEHLAGEYCERYGKLTRICSCVDFLCEDTGIIMRFAGDSLNNVTVYFCRNYKE